MPASPEWQLVFVLPNLSLNTQDAKNASVSLGLEGIAMVSSLDERVTAVRKWSKAADQFLAAFHNGTGDTIHPAALIVRNDWMQGFAKNPEPVIAFRNAVALSTVLPCRARGPSAGWLGASWSDTFDYHPAQLRLDGSKFDLATPALNSIGFKLEGLSLTPDLGLPRNKLGPIDDHIGRRLARAWLVRYRRRQQRRATAKVFRSLETAYQAASVGFKNYSSLNEMGMDAVYWVNAIEVLAMPPRGDVTKWDGARLVGEFTWRDAPSLTHRKYRVLRQRGKQGQPRKFAAFNLPQKIYLSLYKARSKFVHGDSVSERMLLPFGSDAPSLLSLASTVYRAALHSFLKRHWPWKPDLKDLASLDFVAYTSYRDHLLAAVGEEEWH